MPRLKRNSNALEAAKHRLAGLKSLDEAPDFGLDLKIEDFEAEIAACELSLREYNTLNSTIDGKLTEVQTQERALRVKSKRYLAIAKGKFGSDSKEYEQVGGKRDSERKKRTRKTGAGKS